MVRNACKVALPLQSPPLDLLSRSLLVTPLSPHFGHCDTFNPLLTVGDSQYGPDTSMMESVQLLGMPPEWNPTP